MFMSNPGVVELVNTDLSIGTLKIEDNIGESIHIHIADFRIDVTVNELRELATQFKQAINSFIDVENFDCDLFDALFLFQISDYLPDLESMAIKSVKLGNLYTGVDRRFGRIEYRTIKESRVTKALNGYSKEDDDAKQVNSVGITNADRTLKIYESVKSLGYPANNKYAVIFGDSNYIRDGQHRLSAVYMLDGENANVPVIEMKFKENKHAMNKHPMLDYFFKWDRKRLRKLGKVIKKIIKKFIVKIKIKMKTY